ncbi:acyl-CoA:lysophosphatidylglycerol acyltransferase 1-like [Physella acuta]|uniref:acyl-CoA:lysophosphatidylglycerol acyltransferase 1-like n=1 Tax=Physella acuta TaxID=109671 RepID=UPI0027DBC155|nr:acyl-CoA:lysophosphatidylglycerol acyltransferase 1-like [Physella acuta]XP_059178165.1 acyl-CoA:lysophosphatidylglycerol acyltransferase 1-like [Physella acuta]XP_059178166.1 acyl-CoA:lysophosphatidylglycerol acyltransferase 1-like [Physella acuta]
MLNTVYKYTSYTWRFIFFVLSNLYALPCYVIWMLLLTPVRMIAPNIYWKIEAFMFRMLQCMVVTWVDTNGYRVVQCGDDIGQLHDKETILLCNHQSTADTPIVMLTTYGKGMATGNMLWIMFILFKYTNFGLVSCIRKDFFIDQGKSVRDLQLVKLKEHIINAYLPLKRKWIMVFPEGGFLYKRLEASQEYARKYGHPVLKHTTLPRIGAMKTILDAVGEPYEPVNTSDEIDNCEIEDSSRPLKWVVDMTIAYKDGKPLDMFGMCVGYNPRNDVLVHYRAFRARDIPRDDASLTSWLYERYVEKDKMLDHYYTTGELPEEILQRTGLLPKLQKSYLRFDIVEQILIHTFFVLSCYVHYIFIIKPIWGIFAYFLSFIF